MRNLHHLIIDEHQLVALEYNVHLDSTPLIFIHGILNSVYLWEDIQLSQVQSDFHWFSLSLPGHYPAKLPHGFKAQDLTPQHMAEVLSQAIGKLTNERPALLVGYSTGACAALCIAHHAPQLIERMLILEGFAKGVWGEGMRLTQAGGQFTSFLQALINPRGLLGKPGKAITRFGYNILGTDITRMAKTQTTGTVVQSNWETLRAADKFGYYPYFRHFFHADISHWLPDIEIETLILHGDADQIVHPEHARWIHQHLPNSTLRWIPGSGHLPFLERPDYYYDYLSRWINKA